MMVQGTMSAAAWGISQGGFGVIVSETDQGWYGKGFLFEKEKEKQTRKTLRFSTEEDHLFTSR